MTEPGAERRSAPRVKICGLTRRSDAEHAAQQGADYLGVILVPGTPRAVVPEVAGKVVSGLDAVPVAVIANLKLDEAVHAARTVGPSVLQLHGVETPEEAGLIRDAGPWSVWKALRVPEGPNILSLVEPYFDHVDGILLDAWHPRLLGGTGARFPWHEAQELKERLPSWIRFIAAGGLDPVNVQEAVGILQPDVVDVSSGLEASPGAKDPRKVEAFMRAVQQIGKG